MWPGVVWVFFNINEIISPKIKQKTTMSCKFPLPRANRTVVRISACVTPVRVCGFSLEVPHSPSKWQQSIGITTSHRGDVDLLIWAANSPLAENRRFPWVRRDRCKQSMSWTICNQSPVGATNDDVVRVDRKVNFFPQRSGLELRMVFCWVGKPQGW